jgi:RHS repeat-associated protein
MLMQRDRSRPVGRILFPTVLVVHLMALAVPLSPGPARAQGAGLDHFQCYKVKDGSGNVCRAGSPSAGASCITEVDCGGVDDVTDLCVSQPFARGMQVTLADSFETGLFDVQKPVILCNPADKNDEGVLDPDTHLMGYQIKLAKGQCAAGASRNAGGGCKKEEDCGGTANVTALCRLQTPHVARTAIQVENQFHPARGPLLVDTVKPDRLLVPGAKSLTQPIDPPDPEAHEVDHFTCYQVKPSRGAKFQTVRGVAIVDQFDQSRVVDLDKPTRLCLAADKNGEGLKHEAAHLMCYRAKAVKEPPQPKHVKVLGIFVSDQFGPQRLDTVKEDEFCVPSTRIVPNRPPVARDDSATTARGVAVTVDVLENDTDPDADVLVVTEVGAADNGTVEIVADGIAYTPTAGYVGSDQFTYTVSDGRGGTSSATVTVDVTPPANVAPTVAAGNDIEVTLPAGAALVGSASDDGLPSSPGTLTTTWSVVSGPGTVTFVNASASSTTATFSMSGAYVLRLTADDGALSAFDEVRVTVNEAIPGLPPDPSTVAPALAPTLVATLGRGTEFLYTGADPIQTGVAPGTILAKRAGVLRGRVLDRNNAALPGVTITVLRHPELGQTLSRADGRFDMAVNGGGLLTVNYERAGYLPAQRQVRVPWQDYAVLPDVVLIRLDSQVTVVDLSAAVAVQVARGNPVTDVDGTRQATVLFPQGTQADMVMPDGTTQALTTLSVRATEYTVGASGPNAMPGELPAASGYTYAVELSVDEALTAGATRVRFSQPVPFYVENFVGFPVGSLVPTGFYDRAGGQWVSSANGRVLQVVGVTGGLADLDLDGNGTADDATALAALAITDAERARLAALYAPGQSLWRVLLPHFTPWDCNWPYGPPDDAEPPKPKPKPRDKPPKGPKPDCRNGSVIECETQTLGEVVAVAGTPFGLHYRSDRVPGRRGPNIVETRLTETTLPPGLQRVHVEVRVAGREFKEQLTPAPNLFHTFEWDGMDVYGRRLVGTQPVKMRVGFEYLAQYYATPDSFAASFNRFGSGRVTTARTGVGGGGGGGGAISFSAIRTRVATPPIVLYQEFETWVGVGALDARTQALGGWTLSPHHAYDVNGRVLYLGDRGQRGVGPAVPETVSSIAGHNPQFNCGVDGIEASRSCLGPNSLAQAPDGSLYFADPSGRRIRRIKPDGFTETVAGIARDSVLTIPQGLECSSPPCGDGGLATDARLNVPRDVAVAPDGTIYFPDAGRIRRIDRDGIITTFAGTGFACSNASSLPPDCGDGGPARLAAMVTESIAIAADGSIYFSDLAASGWWIIRRIGPDGIVTRFAGTGLQCSAATLPCGDGGMATSATLGGLHRVVVAADGSVYISESLPPRVRRVRPDGIIVTVAGTGAVCPSATTSCGDGGLATLAQLRHPWSIAVGADGSVYIGDLNGLSGGAARVRRVSPEGFITTIAGGGTVTGTPSEGGPPTASAMNSGLVAHGVDGMTIYIAHDGLLRTVGPTMPGLQVGEFTVAAEDGTEIYVFDVTGRHQRTLDALTGAERLRFAYDGAGLLAAITDVATSLATTIERDAGGNPTAIVSPGGLRTTLAIDAAGYLASVTDPAGGVTRFTYRAGVADGLLATLTDARDNEHRYSYDARGRLARDENPAGGVTSLVRTDVTLDRYTVAVTTAAGPTTTYDVEELANGETRRTRTDPSGARRETLVRTDGSRRTTYPDGTVTTLVLRGDPRWKLQTPVLVSLTTTTPGGLTQTFTSTRTVTLANPADLLSLQTQTATFTVNGRTTTTVYQAATRTVTLTSPAGRQAVVTLDARGRVARHRVVGLDETVYAYDAQGQLTDITTGAGAQARTWHIDYNGNRQISGATDPLGRPISFTYDAAGRLASRTLPGSDPMIYGYDASGNLTSLTPPGRTAHAFGYTAVDQEATYTPPALSTGATVTTRSYDLDGRLSRLTSPGAAIMDLAYDTAGRLDTITLPRGVLDFSYDAADRVSGLSAPGGLTLGFTYDGVLMTGSVAGGAVPGSVGRTYDASFRRTAISLNGADPVGLTYDADDLLTQVGTLGLTRHPQHGLVTGSTLGVVTDARTYNGSAELASYTASANGGARLSVQYTRDALGRITTRVETLEGVTDTYTYAYDATGQLSSVRKNGVVTEEYTYDANGSRLTATRTTGTAAGIYDVQDRLTQHGVTTYAYTAGGDLALAVTGGQTTTYSYDQLGVLLGVTPPTGPAITYLVDGLHRRIGKRADGALVQGFIYEDDLRPIAELDGTGAVLSRFVYATRPNVPDYLVKGGVAYRIITDHLGSPRLVLNTTDGTVAQRMDYDGFGRVTLDTNPGFQPFGFAGGLYDRDTRLVRFGARDYDAETGRWTSKDPIGFAPGDPNLYRYVLGDPINLTDPSGHGPFQDFVNKYFREIVVATYLLLGKTPKQLPIPPEPPPQTQVPPTPPQPTTGGETTCLGRFLTVVGGRLASFIPPAPMKELDETMCRYGLEDRCQMTH